MRWLLISAFILSSITTHAEWGRGLWGGSNCNQPYEQAPQSYSANDEIGNVRGQINQDSRALRDLEAQLNRVPPRIDEARNRMSRVISRQGLAAIEEHYNQRREHTKYRKSCNPNARADANLVPIPDGFCYHNPNAADENSRYADLWDRMADKETPGRVIDNICRFHIPPQSEAPDEADQNECAQGLSEYYSALDEQRRLNDEIADLRRRVEGHESRIGRINTEVSEGRYCATCTSERRGYSTNSTGDQMMDMVVPLMVMSAALLSRSQQQQRRRPGPAMLPPQGYGQQVPYRAYPARPYAAPVRGYYGMHNQVYGAVPGSIGRGAFGCNNTSPLAFGNPSFGNDLSSIFNGPSPFNAHHAAPFMNPVATNRMFNPGFGPGFMPRLGGNGRNAPARLNPIRARGPMTQMPQRFGQVPGTMIGGRPGFGFGNQPAMLPFQRGGMQQSPFMNYGIQQGQFAGVSPMFPGYPQASLMNQYYGGGNQFYNAPATLGYRGGPLTSVSNVPGMSSNVLGNYVHQMNQISQNIQMLGSGSYYAPPTLAFPSGGGATALPGTTVVPGTGTGAPNVIRPGGGTVAPAPGPAPSGPGVVTPVKKK